MRIALVVALCVSTAAFADYADPGPNTVVSSSGSVTVSGKSYTYEVRGPTSAASAPVIGVSHAFCSSPSDYAAWMGLLASRGFIVVAPSYGFCSSAHAANADVLLAAVDHAVAAQGARADPTRVALIGHSAGGLSAFLAATKRPSLKALVLLDAVDQDPSIVPASGFTGYAIPTLFTFAEPNSSCNRSNNTSAWYAALSNTTPHERLRIVGATHCDAQDPASGFCTFGCPQGGASAVAAHQTLFKRYASAWFARYLGCDLAALQTLSGTADVTAGAIADVQQIAVDAVCSVTPTDGGTAADAGSAADSGIADAGDGDGGESDAGAMDGGGDHGGAPDAGDVTDGGEGSDAGSPLDDGGLLAADAGTDAVTPQGSGCNCSTAGMLPFAGLALLAAARRKRS